MSPPSYTQQNKKRKNLNLTGAITWCQWCLTRSRPGEEWTRLPTSCLPLPHLHYFSLRGTRSLSHGDWLLTQGASFFAKWKLRKTKLFFFWNLCSFLLLYHATPGRKPHTEIDPVPCGNPHSRQQSWEDVGLEPWSAGQIAWCVQYGLIHDKESIMH